jgi:hypothetical protein
MPELPRDRSHFYLQNVGQPEQYTTRQRPRTPPPPVRERETHARALEAALNRAIEGARARAEVRPPQEVASGGFYLQFQLPPGNTEFVQNIENRSKGIELVSVRQSDDNAPAFATVFIPFRSANYFQRILDEYRTQVTAKAQRPRHEALVNRIDSIALAAIRALFTDDENLLPAQDAQTWWEIWIRGGLVEQFQAVARTLGVNVAEDQIIDFPEREVFLAQSDFETLGRLMARTDAMAEIRLARDTPASFLEMNNIEQAEWVRELLARVAAPNDEAVAVCILDSGITQTHSLLSVALGPTDVHTYNPTWGTGDSAFWQGHGTAMGGITLYGDLKSALLRNGPITLVHRLESVKMLDPNGVQHDPKLYGVVTSECVSRTEVAAPRRPRAFCMAVTSDLDVKQGKPSSWSSAVDKICFGDETSRRLFFVSAGNVDRQNIPAADYLNRNDVEPIFNPAQAWNAVTVGAYTEKTTIVDRTFDGWTPLAPSGELAPTSRTSLTWERQWPTKPDIVCEGGNWATDGEQVDCPDDLALLTTHHQPQVRQFSVLGDTSAATAMAANMAGQILASRPQSWPETVRGLLVHSAEWTPRMKQHLSQPARRQEKIVLLRRYGYGVPNFQRAVYSSLNDATFVVQDSIQPFWRAPDGVIKTRHMHLHSLPWPRTELELLAETEVELRMTLSYFVEPNPGERGWVRRHRYASHGLRFALKRSVETIDEFRARINRAVELEEQGAPVDAGPDDWFLGTLRDTGSIHSDYWRGIGAELGRRDAIAVYPVGGWWKEKRALQRYDRSVRYCLVVSLRAVAGAIDIYTPIQNAIAAAIQIEI